MTDILFDNLLATLRSDPAQHNRWKRLSDYEAKGTAKVAATKLRRRHQAAGYVFKVVPYGDRWAVGVLYKQTDADGRMPATGTPQEAV
jgi:hypothetical protein